MFFLRSKVTNTSLHFLKCLFEIIDFRTSLSPCPSIIKPYTKRRRLLSFSSIFCRLCCPALSLSVRLDNTTFIHFFWLFSFCNQNIGSSFGTEKMMQQHQVRQHPLFLLFLSLSLPSNAKLARKQTNGLRRGRRCDASILSGRWELKEAFLCSPCFETF